jgi:hypothetical protein
LRPVCLAALIVIVFAALSWPVGAIARRCYRAAPALRGSDLMAYRLVSVFSWLVLVTLGGWLTLLADFIPLVDNPGSLDGRIWLQEIGGGIAIVGLTALAFWNLLRVWRGGRRGRFAKVWSALEVLAVLSILWVMAMFHLLSLGAHY